MNEKEAGDAFMLNAHQQGVKAVGVHLHRPFQAGYGQTVLVVLRVALPQHEPRLNTKKGACITQEGTKKQTHGMTSRSWYEANALWHE